MKVLSLFDGIACGRVALERAGIPVWGRLIGIVYCPDCGLYCTVEKNYASEEEIANRWNRRC